ncbi:hypothetical protein [Myxosarcina sp. GI1(2024)]
MLSKRRTPFVPQLRCGIAPAIADAGFDQFVTILKWVVWKTDTYFAKVYKNDIEAIALFLKFKIVQKIH